MVKQQSEKTGMGGISFFISEGFEAFTEPGRSCHEVLMHARASCELATPPHLGLLCCDISRPSYTMGKSKMPSVHQRACHSSFTLAYTHALHKVIAVHKGDLLQMQDMQGSAAAHAVLRQSVSSSSAM